MFLKILKYKSVAYVLEIKIVLITIWEKDCISAMHEKVSRRENSTVRCHWDFMSR